MNHDSYPHSFYRDLVTLQDDRRTQNQVLYYGVGIRCVFVFHALIALSDIWQ